MLIYEHIRQMSQHFFACTQLPIQTFDFTGNLISSVGYNPKLTQIFEHYHVFEQVKQRMLLQTEKCMLTIPCLDSISFAASWICGKNINRGFHILGPYTALEISKITGIPYKPACCLPHLFTLLSNISADSLYFQQRIKKFHSSPYTNYVKKAIDTIDARYFEPITLTDIATHLNISKGYLCSLFKKETGKTFSRYLNEKRIEESKRLLQSEHLSMLDIALSVGFNNQNYYNIIFKNLMKQTPLEYRNQQQLLINPAYATGLSS